jgi:response regulator of citrate/malate metabolism
MCAVCPNNLTVPRPTWSPLQRQQPQIAILDPLPPMARIMFSKLETLADQNVVQISVANLAKLLNIQQETARHRLNTLEKYNAVRINRMYNGGGLEIRLILK